MTGCDRGNAEVNRTVSFLVVSGWCMLFATSPCLYRWVLAMAKGLPGWVHSASWGAAEQRGPKGSAHCYTKHDANILNATSRRTGCSAAALDTG